MLTVSAIKRLKSKSVRVKVSLVCGTHTLFRVKFTALKQKIPLASVKRILNCVRVIPVCVRCTLVYVTCTPVSVTGTLVCVNRTLGYVKFVHVLKK